MGAREAASGGLGAMNYTEQEKRLIKFFAGLDKPAQRPRQDAIGAHRAMMQRCLRSDVTKGGTLPYGDPHFEFMREIDNPCPCPILKAKWRAEVLRNGV
jgi:hypothetical protein